MTDEFIAELKTMDSFFTSGNNSRRILVGQYYETHDVPSFCLDAFILDNPLRSTSLWINGRQADLLVAWNKDLALSKNDAYASIYKEGEDSEFHFLVCENGLGYLAKDAKVYGLGGILNLSARARVDGKMFDDFFAECYTSDIK